MYPIENCFYANGEPLLTGTIRTVPEDFIVDEKFAFDFTGSGEHVLLKIQKRNTNTEWLARQIVKLANVRKMDVSYAGLKDRNAVTTQWFSVWLPKGDEPDWTKLEDENITLLEVTRHNRKLRRGSLNENKFTITIRNIEGDSSDFLQRIENIKKYGVPNYFGEQRFGHNGLNLEKAEAMFGGVKIKDRHKRSLYLSAARSFLFNHLLSQRIKDKAWSKAVCGDVMLLDNSRSYFLVEEITDEIERRLDEFDIHPSGCLWGKGKLLSSGNVSEVEQALKETFPLFTQGLEDKGLKQERRALRLQVKHLEYKFNNQNNNCTISFSLAAGGYATSVLRECFSTINHSSPI